MVLPQSRPGELGASASNTPGLHLHGLETCNTNFYLLFTSICWLVHDFTLSQTLLLQLLEENIVAFVKDELKNMRRVLSSGYPECLERVYKEEERSSKAAFLEITGQFLRRMKQEALADRLQRGEGRFSKHAGKHFLMI